MVHPFNKRLNYASLIAGLGNPTKQYEHTRHNAGFDVLDRLADLLNTGISQSKFNALITTVRTGQETILLMKPQTYMNNSGEAVIQAVQFYKIPVDQILVIHDDLDLPVGKIRIRTSGSAGGQKGMKNIIDHLHTQDIARIRVGIDKNPLIPIVDYVLGKVPADQREDYQAAINHAAEAAKASMTMPISDVMNRFNRSR